MESRKRVQVVALGEAIVDFVPATDKAEWTFVAKPGGAPANVAAALARLGIPVAFIGRVGRDALGDLLTRALHDAGVDTRLLQRDAQRPTPVAVVLPEQSDVNRFLLLRSFAADGALRLDSRARATISNARILHVGTLSLIDPLSRCATLAAVTLARAQGVAVSVDVNLRPSAWRDRVHMLVSARSLLACATIAKLTAEELAALDLRPADLVSSGVRCVLITDGARTATAITREGVVERQPPEARMIDPTGAGDAFIGAFLYSVLTDDAGPSRWLSRDAVSRALTAAVAAGTFVVERSGAMESLPRLAELADAIMSVDAATLSRER